MKSINLQSGEQGRRPVVRGQRGEPERAVSLLRSFVVSLVAVALLALPSAARADITSNLLGHWRFLASDGTDSSGNGNTLTLVDTPSFTTGPFGSAPAISLNGTSQGATRALDLTGTNAVTVAWWQQLNSTTSNDPLAYEFTTNTNSFTTGFFCNAKSSTESGHIAVDLKGDVGINGGHVTRPTDNAWSHVVATFNKGLGNPECKLYLNGAVQTLTSNGSSNYTNNFGNATLFLGSRNNTTLWFKGEMADIRVYTRELSSGDVTELYNWSGQVAHGLGKPPRFAGNGGGMVGIAKER